MRVATAKAPANIAFIKYWGKIDPQLNIPTNSSISMNLSAAQTTTTVVFTNDLDQDVFVLNKAASLPAASQKVTTHLNRIRAQAGIDTPALVVSHNSFPTAAGIASSASGFAALTLAGCAAAGLHLSKKQLSQLARQGSGSACRSIPDGFVEWQAGYDDDNSYAFSLYPEDHWDLTDLVATFDSPAKNTKSTAGHSLSQTSPFFAARQQYLVDVTNQLKVALREKDFNTFGQLIEQEALNMHAVMLTSQPSLLYWQPKTLEIIQSVWQLRENGVATYFTIDAGAAVHVICQQENARQVEEYLLQRTEEANILTCTPCKGAHVTNKHLSYTSHLK